MPRALHQFIVYFRDADAVGNQIAAIHRIAEGLGISSCVYYEHFGKHPEAPSQHYSTCQPQPGDALLLHYGGATELDEAFRNLAQSHTVSPWVCYHNVTPGRFFAPFDRGIAVQLEKGRERIRSGFFGNAQFAAGSHYNADELRQLGFVGEIAALPYVLNPDRLLAQRSTAMVTDRALQLHDRVNWLFVGRMAPNKRQDALVRAFAYYHNFINPNSRLILAGSVQGMESYLDYVRAVIDSLTLQDHVVLNCDPSDLELAACYVAADVFVCASEHEGFCVPLIEAMWFDIPIVALRRAAVTETLGDSGIGLNSLHPALIAESAHAVLSNDDLRSSVCAAQQLRLKHFASDRTEPQIIEFLKHLS